MSGRERILRIARETHDQELLSCPICDVNVKAKNLLHHYDKQHKGQDIPSAMRGSPNHSPSSSQSQATQQAKGQEQRATSGEFYQTMPQNNNDLMKQLIMELNKVFSEIKMEENTKTELIQYIHTKFENSIDIFFLQLMLQILYEYEKRYLDLIREYKEEIKLSATIQEDLRKERTNFFSEALKEVSNTLKESQVDSDIASQWIKELVNSYTRSLDICSGLIEEETISMIGEIRRKVKRNRSRLRKSSCFVWRNRL